MGQVFDLAGHGSFEYEQRGFETAVDGILNNKVFGTTAQTRKGRQFGLGIEARVVPTIWSQ